MTTNERLDELENQVQRLAAAQTGMGDVIGMTIEGQQRIAERAQGLEALVREIGERQKKTDEQLADITDKLNALIAVVDGFIRRDRP